MADDYNFLNSQHPLYQQFINDVALYKSCYLDSGFINDTTIPQFSLELDKDYKTRKKRAFHINLFHHLVNIPSQAIFSDKMSIVREFPEKYKKLKDYIENINGNGKHINKLMSELTVRSLAGKQSYAYIENPVEKDGVPIVKPYWFDPVINWDIDKSGSYNWVMIKGQQYSQPDPKRHPTLVDVITLFTKEYWGQWNTKTGDKIGEQIVNESGIVPLIKILITDENDDGIGEGWGDKLVKFDIELLNTLSLYQIELYLLLFNVITMQSTNIEKAKEFVKLRSESGIFGYEEGMNPPEYLSPAIETLKEKRDYIGWLINTERMVAGFKGKDEAVEKSQSGIAKLLDLHNTSETIANVSKAIENAEKKIWYYLAIFNGIITKDIPLSEFSREVIIKYPTDFSILDLDNQFDKFERLLLMGLSNPDAQAEIEKTMVISAMSNYLSDEQLENIKKGYENIEVISQQIIEKENKNAILNNSEV